MSPNFYKTCTGELVAGKYGVIYRMKLESTSRVLVT